MRITCLATAIGIVISGSTGVKAQSLSNNDSQILEVWSILLQSPPEEYAATSSSILLDNRFLRWFDPNEDLEQTGRPSRIEYFGHVNPEILNAFIQQGIIEGAAEAVQNTDNPKKEGPLELIIGKLSVTLTKPQKADDIYQVFAFWVTATTPTTPSIAVYRYDIKKVDGEWSLIKQVRFVRG